MTEYLSNTVFRDNILGNRLIPVNEGILGVIDSPAFQRLRNIRQMGLGSFVFPTAEHSRFAHSIGVYGTAKVIFQALRQRAQPLAIPFPAMRFDEEAEHEFSLAAMCHDIGHTAYSHVLEGTLLPYPFRNHEDCTLAILQEDPKLSKAISNDADLDAVVLMIKQEHPNRALSQLISGLFDVDRCDYLLRDSQNAGVQYGLFDFNWMMRAISLSLNNLGQPILLFNGPRGVDAMRQFLAARRHMYRQVYLQATIRAAQILMKSIFNRISDNPPPESIVSQSPSGLRSILRKDRISIGDFLSTTDIEVNYMIRMLSVESNDLVLRRLSEMFVNRNFPKAVIDSSKTHDKMETVLGIEFDNSEELIGYQMPLLPGGAIREAMLVEECREIVRQAMIDKGEPGDLANYLVASERVTFNSFPSSDIIFSYRDGPLNLEDLLEDRFNSPFPELLESFEIYRLFAPTDSRDIVLHHLKQREASLSGG